MSSLRVILSLSVILIVMSPSVILLKASSVNGYILVPHDYSSIQAAINRAEPGSTILVEPGKYVENLRITKPLTILGSGNSTVIENSDSSDTIDVPRGVDGASLANFFVNGSGATSSGIYIGGENCSLQNITVANHDMGIFMWDSSGNILRSNRLINNRYNLEVWGLPLSHFMQDIDSSNLVDGRRVYYLVNEHDKIVPSDAGFVAIVNSTNITIKDVNLTRNYSGILLAYATSSLILNATCSGNEEGILAFLSNNSTIVGSRFDSNEWVGISFCSCSGNCVAGNTVSSNANGMYLDFSSLIPDRSEYNSICGNVVSQNSHYGIYFDGSSRNNVCNNEITNDSIGVCLDSSGDYASQNVFANNTFSQNIKSNVQIDGSSDNNFYHNSFLSNTVQISYVEHQNLPIPANKWDDDYPIGGNFWSDYNGTDHYSGPYQNETGSDGIGDSSYVINLNNMDRYPLFAAPEKNTVLNVSFSQYPDEPKLFDFVSFVDETTSSSGIALRIWVFSDNQIFRSQNLSRQFVQSQNYTAVLYALDNQGVIGSAEATFQVRKFFSNLTLTLQHEGVLSDEIPIKAELTSENSEALINATIDFYIVKGTSKERIGASKTNSTGEATILYSFNETGTVTIYAEYQGDQWYSPSNHEASLKIADSGSLSPLLIGLTISSLTIVGLISLFAWRRKGKRQSAASKEVVASH
jgi:parallel beta-helix repeat protein